MTEYELIDAAATMQSMSQSIYEFGIAVLTGYILLAYYIGKDLTLGQVSFINAMFILSQPVVFFGAREKIVLASYYESAALKLNPSLPFAEVIQGQDPSLPIVPITSVLIPLAALAFMWRVRHPKTE